MVVMQLLELKCGLAISWDTNGSGLNDPTQLLLEGGYDSKFLSFGVGLNLVAIFAQSLLIYFFLSVTKTFTILIKKERASYNIWYKSVNTELICIIY